MTASPENKPLFEKILAKTRECIESIEPPMLKKYAQKRYQEYVVGTDEEPGIEKRLESQHYVLSYSKFFEGLGAFTEHGDYFSQGFAGYYLTQTPEVDARVEQYISDIQGVKRVNGQYVANTDFAEKFKKNHDISLQPGIDIDENNVITNERAIRILDMSFITKRGQYLRGHGLSDHENGFR